MFCLFPSRYEGEKYRGLYHGIGEAFFMGGHCYKVRQPFASSHQTNFSFEDITISICVGFSIS